MRINFSRRAAVVGAVAVALLSGSAMPSWAAPVPTATVSGVVYLDNARAVGVQVCDVFGENCSLTEADGAYVLTISQGAVLENPAWCLAVRPATEEQRGLFAPVEWGIRDFTNCRLPVSVVDGGTVENYDIHLKAFAVVTGQIVNAAGKPVVGAEVESGVPTKGVTDSAGRFGVRQGVFSYDDAHLEVTAAGYERAYSFVTELKGEIGRIVLAKAGDDERYSITGKVTNAKGRAVVGARVCVVGGKCVATTDDQGVYSGLLSGRKEQIEYWKVRVTTVNGKTWVTRSLSSTPLANFSSRENFRLAAVVGHKPVILGARRVGRKLVVRVGKWSPAPVKLKYQWYADGNKIVGATKSMLKVTKGLRGKRLAVKVTGSKTGCESVSSTSALTAKVTR